jgi:hypothetical protein
VRRPDLEDLWRESRERPGAERKLVRRCGAYGLLVPGKWLPERPNGPFRGMPPGLTGLRYGSGSTVFCTQFKRKDRHARLGGGARADAITDGTAHNAVWVEMGETDMRQREAARRSGARRAGGGALSRYRRCPRAIIGGAKEGKYSLIWQT